MVMSSKVTGEFLPAAWPFCDGSMVILDRLDSPVRSKVDGLAVKNIICKAGKPFGTAILEFLQIFVYSRPFPFQKKVVLLLFTKEYGRTEVNAGNRKSRFQNNLQQWSQ